MKKNYLTVKETFDILTDYHGKDPNELLIEFMRRYNDKYEDDYKKAIEHFWNK